MGPSRSPERTSREIEENMEKLNIGDLAEKPEDVQGEVVVVQDDELERFRSEWRNEVKSKQHPTGSATNGLPLSPDRKQNQRSGSKNGAYPTGNLKGKDRVDDGISTSTLASPPKDDRRSFSTQLSPPNGSSLTLVPSRSSAHSTSTAGPTSPLIKKRVSPVAEPQVGEADDEEELGIEGKPRWGDKLKTFGRLFSGRNGTGADAVTVYARAVEAEQGGQLNDALKLYRQAFKMDDNVDRAYTLRKNRPKDEPTTPSSTDLVSPTPPSLAPFSFQRTIQTNPDYEKSHPHPSLTSPTSALKPLPVRTSPLTSLLQQTPIPPSETTFLPADENLPVHISLLPSEIIDQILSHLDIPAIETFGTVSWRARYLTAYSEQWRIRAEKIYSKVAVNPGRVSMADLGRKYGAEWRTVLVEEERVRMDGCYIAVCHYIRPGAGDEWVTVTHMITYHRFLRFYPDGTVISFLTTDHPSEVVPLLKPSLRAKGLHIGTYTLLPPDTSSNPPLAGGKKTSRILISDLLEPGAPAPKYEFEMDLSLRETSRGKWNKLDIVDYRSINLATGEVLGLALKHQKPYYFSKVRSYHPTF